MKTYKLVNVVFNVVTLSFLLSGCYPTGESPVDESGIISENSTISQNNEPQYNNKVENLTVSVDLPENMINEVGAIDLSVRKWDNEAIKKELIGEKTITNDAQTPSDDFPDEIIQVYDTEDNWRLILESGRITFDNKELIGKYNYGYFSTAVEQLHFDNMPDELTGFSKSDAQKITMDLLDKLNLIYVSEPDIYAITCEMANEFLSQGFAADSDAGYAQWTKDDEIYILIYSLLYE
ncbi:MAG: hypothetical protein K2O14_09360, partial [Oscillospiraceae bacterium]|nr:hypothetical protein [Oscillospiraceae bacterium]